MLSSKIRYVQWFKTFEPQVSDTKYGAIGFGDIPTEILYYFDAVIPCRVPIFFFLGIETHILSYFVLEALINFARKRDQNYENWLDSLRNIKCWTLEQC